MAELNSSAGFNKILTKAGGSTSMRCGPIRNTSTKQTELEMTMRVDRRSIFVSKGLPDVKFSSHPTLRLSGSPNDLQRLFLSEAY